MSDGSTSTPLLRDLYASTMGWINEHPELSNAVMTGERAVEQRQGMGSESGSLAAAATRLAECPVLTQRLTPLRSYDAAVACAPPTSALLW